MRKVMLAVGALSILASAGVALRAQAVTMPAAPVLVSQPAAATKTPQPIRLDIVITRTKGATTVSRLPYALMGIVGQRMQLRLGSNIPIPQVNGNGTVSYEAVGSNFDGDVTPDSDGTYQLRLTLDDSSVLEQPDQTNKAPVIRSYVVTTTLIVRTGEAMQVNLATDKTSGETITAQVTLTALKP